MSQTSKGCKCHHSSLSRLSVLRPGELAEHGKLAEQRIWHLGHVACRAALGQLLLLSYNRSADSQDLHAGHAVCGARTGSQRATDAASWQALERSADTALAQAEQPLSVASMFLGDVLQWFENLYGSQVGCPQMLAAKCAGH